MVFNSLTFLAFFASVLVLHNMPFSWRLKKFNLLWLSYVFYAAWNPPFVVLLMCATVVNWFSACRIYKAETPAWRRFWLLTALLPSLGMVGFFKYGHFFLQNTAVLLGTLGVDYQPPDLTIVLPIGISFYAFVALSYTLDVYFKGMKPWDSCLDYALLVTFFPHLLAGPILRGADFLPQCREVTRPSTRQFAWGIALVILGLFEKTVLADYFLGPIADQVFGERAAPGFCDAWFSTFAFAGQIFYDFSGYSLCAIGVAQCLGFWLPRNFHYPYGAVGFSDFWHRWHVSLSTWLRDYLYIPLGGNRKGSMRTHFNVMVTMLLGGLWHGASWTFVVWGGLHGIYLVVERVAKRIHFCPQFWANAGVQLALAIGTYLLVCITWVFFRAHTFERAFQFLASMLGFQDTMVTPMLSTTQIVTVVFVTAALLSSHYLMRERTLEDVVTRTPWLLSATVIAVMLVMIVVTPGEDRAFIYFQF